MECNKQLPQVQEILELLQKAKQYSLKSLERIEKLNAYTTQIQGRNTFVQQSLREQSEVMGLLSEQNPSYDIFKTSKDRVDEALNHSLALAQLSERSLEILDLSADEVSYQEDLIKASSLLKAVVVCIDMIATEKLEAFIQTTASNHHADNSQSDSHSLQTLKQYLKD